MQLAQLQGDALAQIARADAGGLERLHRREHPLHVRGRGLDLGHQAQANVLQVIVQIAVVGNGVGDHARDREVDRRELGELELLDELLLQRLAVLVAEVAAAVVIARPGGIRRRRWSARPRPRPRFPLPALRADPPGWCCRRARHTSPRPGRSSRSRTGIRGASSASSSSASSITLVSRVSRTCACRSSEGNCSRRMACCSCGVMVSCWPMRSCRLGFNIVL